MQQDAPSDISKDQHIVAEPRKLSCEPVREYNFSSYGYQQEELDMVE